MDWVPKEVFFTSGVGKGDSITESYSKALRYAKIGNYSLIKVSSILPPKCRIISRKDGLKHLKIGQSIFAVISKRTSKKKGEFISASIGSAKPKLPNSYGYLAEYNASNLTIKSVKKYVGEMAVDMLTTSLGFKKANADLSDEKVSQSYKFNTIVASNNIDSSDKFTTVAAFAVFVL